MSVLKKGDFVRLSEGVLTKLLAMDPHDVNVLKQESYAFARMYQHRAGRVVELFDYSIKVQWDCSTETSYLASGDLHRLELL